MLPKPLQYGSALVGCLLLSFIFGAVLCSSASATTPPKVDYTRDIQPILQANCYGCHGAAKASAGLRLHQREDALRGSDSGPVILPGKSAESPLIRYVMGEDVPMRMPLGLTPLTTEQIEFLRAWIDAGAPWPEAGQTATDTSHAGSMHWAFQPIQKPEPPAVKQESWIRNPIDRFVLAKLEELGIDPSPEADRVTLIRRLSLDLLGLPPSPEEVVAFVHDKRSDAYERLVDRLLASPHFGERWGRHWLDLARYADSDGFEKDLVRPYAWRYRHWVIDAINTDMPFDTFTIQQLAGDLLPDAGDEERLVATGFHRNTLTNREGGVDQEQFRNEAVVDRTNTTGTVWLGLTVGCAQCHSHKYDPITQREYYNLFAFFNNTDEKDISAPLESEVQVYHAAKENYEAVRETLNGAVAEYEKRALSERQTNWEKRISPSAIAWTPLVPIKAGSNQGAAISTMPDGSLAVSSKKAEREIFMFTAEAPPGEITGFKLEVSVLPSLSGIDPSRLAQTDFMLAEFSVRADPVDENEKTQLVPLQDAYAGFTLKVDRAPETIDGNADTSWHIPAQYGLGYYVAVFETKENFKTSGSRTLTIQLDQKYNLDQSVARFRLSATTTARPIRTDGLPAEIAAIVRTDAERRNETQRSQLHQFYEAIDPVLSSLKLSLNEHEKGKPEYPKTQALTMVERSEERRETHIHIRGDFLQPGDKVEPHTLSVLPPLKPRNGKPDRLDLARWLVSPENPLTPRVTANRVWMYLFGTGLVKTAEDFGTRGEAPSHPELLDWLARRYLELGWSRKTLIETIVTSATYRQASGSREDLMDLDPENRLLARQNRNRLPAEIIRDVYLAASGLLNPEIGGPSVRPPLPPDVADLGYAGSVKWPVSQGKDRFRRGMYILFQRTVPYPMLMTFDCPDSNTCLVRREISNTPLQALTLLNDPVFVECAQAFARRILAEKHDANLEERIRLAFSWCVAREPESLEIDRLVQLFGELLAMAQNDPAAAEKLVGGYKPEGIRIEEAAAWVGLARTILNLDETITRG